MDATVNPAMDEDADATAAEAIAALETLAPPVRADHPAIGSEQGFAVAGEAPADARAAVARALGILSVERLAFSITLRGGDGPAVALTGRLEADVVQECRVSLEPVPDTINAPMGRRWLPPRQLADALAALALEPDDRGGGKDRSMSEGAARGADSGSDRGAVAFDLSVDGADELEPLTELLDLAPVLLETLALALEPFPRAASVEFGGAAAAPDGTEPLDAQALKPFAGLAALRDRLNGDDG